MHGFVSVLFLILGFSAMAAETNAIIEGSVLFAGVREEGGELTLRVGNNDIRVEVAGTNGGMPGFSQGAKVRVTGRYQEILMENGSLGPGMLLVSNWSAIQLIETNSLTPESGRNTIETVAGVRAISPELASQQLRVSIRGVVTAVIPRVSSAVIQDSTKGIAISLQGLRGPRTLKRGDVYQIEGVTSRGLFAPIIVAWRIRHLGTGRMPEPLHPSWDQMMNGSIDAQYAEIEGMVMAVHNQQMEMLTDSGKITVELGEFQPEQVAGYENALVRIRGCFFATYNATTHEVTAGLLRVLGAVEIVRAAPRDLFSATQKSIGELLLYDPKAAPFRHLKVSGQVIYGRGTDYFLMDGTNGMHVAAKKSDSFAAGDLVDAVGFLDLSGPAAELKEAVLRNGERPVARAHETAAGSPARGALRGAAGPGGGDIDGPVARRFGVCAGFAVGLSRIPGASG